MKALNVREAEHRLADEHDRCDGPTQEPLSPAARAYVLAFTAYMKAHRDRRDQELMSELCDAALEELCSEHQDVVSPAAQQRPGARVVPVTACGPCGKAALTDRRAGRRHRTSIYALNAIIWVLRAISDAVDERHCDMKQRRLVVHCAGMIADELGLTPAHRWRCVMAAGLHDIGKVAVPDTVLCKPGPLSEEEWRVVRQHPVTGRCLLELVPGLSRVSQIVSDHHERLDGSGYPTGLRASEISVEARILSACDTWAAMLNDRPYRKALSRKGARAELAGLAGRQLDRNVVEVLLRLDAAGALTPAAESDADFTRLGEDRDDGGAPTVAAGRSR